MLFDEEWSEWLPIYVWLIEHDEGLILVDTGETTRVHERGYHPRWHPFYRRAVHFSVHPEEELGPQLRALGIGAARRPPRRAHASPHRPCRRALPRDRQPHAGSRQASSRTPAAMTGRIMGYLPHRWPKWWQPEFIRFDRRRVGSFDEAMPLTARGDVLIVPTPGHTPHHVSVLVSGEPSFLLAGDTSYNQELLLAGKGGWRQSGSAGRARYARAHPRAREGAAARLSAVARSGVRHATGESIRRDRERRAASRYPFTRDVATCAKSATPTKSGIRPMR